MKVKDVKEKLKKAFRKFGVVGLVSVAVVVALVLLSRPSPEPIPGLTFVVIPSEEAGATQGQFAPFVDYLSESIGRPIELLTVSDYTAVVEAMKYGHADIARFAAFGYVMATQETDVEVLVTAIKTTTNQPSYYGLIVVRADSGITDLNGATFAYVDVGSTSGYLVPSTYIMREGIELGEVLFAGSHYAVIEAVKNGSVAAGAIADNRYALALEKGIIAEGELTILWESDPIPNCPIAVRKDMDESLKVQLVEAFLSAPQELVEGCGVGETGYVVMSDSDYDFVREVQAAHEETE